MKVKDKVMGRVDNQPVPVSRAVHKQAKRAADKMSKHMVRVSESVHYGKKSESSGEEELYTYTKQMAGKYGFRVMQIALWMWRRLLRKNLDDKKMWRGIRVMYEPIERYCMDYNITSFKKTDSYKRAQAVEYEDDGQL